MKHLRAAAKRIQSRPLFLACLAFVLIFWSFLLIENYYDGYAQPYGGNYFHHSDDAGQSNVLWDWQHGRTDGARLGDDNWFIKFPLYVVTNNLPVSPAKQILINSWVVLMATAVMIVAVLYKFSKLLITDKNKQKVALVFSTLALAVISAQAFGTIKMSNSRNIEIGIFFILLLALYLYEHRSKWFETHIKFKVAGLVLLYGMLCADDPLFTYLTLVPLAGLSLVFYFFGHDKAKPLRLFLFAVATWITSVVFKFLLVTLLPLKFYDHHSGIAPFSKFLQNAGNFFDSGIGILGIDIFGRQIGRISTVLVVVTILLVAISLGAIVCQLKKKPTLFAAFVACLWLWIPFVGMITTLRVSGEVSRYLILLPMLVPLGVLLAVGKTKLSRQWLAIGGVLLVLLGLTIYTKTTTLVQSAKKPNDKEYVAVANLKAAGLTKGYGLFRFAGITSYLSGHEVAMYPVKCSGDRLFIRDIFFDHASLKVPAQRSFYVYSRHNFKRGICGYDTVIKQFGKPVETKPFTVGSDSQIFIYNYDITTKMSLKK